VDGERVRIWNTVHGEVVNMLEGFHRNPVVACVFSPDGSTIATASGDKTFALWSAEEKQSPPEFHIKAHDGWVQTLAYSPDGKYLATGSSDKTAKVWIVQL